MITAWLTIFTLALTVKLSRETNDLLNLFRPKSNLPPELNDFLLEVQNHKKDFAFIRNVVTQRKRNEKKFSENNILVEDNNENLNDLQNEINLLHNINKEEGGNLNNKNTPAATTKKGFKYSKYLHSPIRLRRELDLNVDHKSSAGVINRPGIRNSLNDKNKYQAESTYERNDDKSQQKISDIKKKREIEISIKSDGRVIKKIDENENGPKSVILNIKTGTDGTDCASTRSFSSNGGLGRVQTMINIIQQPNTTPLSPNDFSYIPSIDSNADQNKNPAVPINPISSNAMLNPQPYAANNLDTYQSQNDKTSGASRAVNNVSKKMENNKGKSNNHMEKTIDTALNNQYDLDEHPKEGEPGTNAEGQNSDFERVQGLVMDNSNSNSNNNANPSESNFNTIKKRKRWEPIDLDENGNILNPAMGKLNENLINGENVDYIVSLEQGLTTTFIDELQDNSAIKNLEQANGDEFHLKPNDRFHIVEEATKDIYIVPITKKPCPPNEEINEISPEEREEEILLEKAIQEEEADGNQEETPSQEECDKNELKEEIKEEIKEVEQQEAKEEEKELERQEAIEEEKEEERQEAKEEEKELEQQEAKEEEKENCKKHEHKTGEKPETEKRSSKKENKKSKKKKHKKPHPKKEFLLLPYNEEKRGARYKKHLPALPKYKRKHTRQHQRKKPYADSQYMNSFYDDSDNPEETFDFIPSFNQRQLKSANYDYDPYLVDFDNHLKENIIADSKELTRDNERNEYDNDPVKESDDLFEEDKAENEQIQAKGSKLRNNRDVPIPEYMFHYFDPSQVHFNKRSLNSLDYQYNPKMIDDSEIHGHYDKDTHQLENTVGIRKKMKSEDDYSDEEDAVFDKSTKRRKINRTIDQDNDDEYNYSEISNGTISWPLIENVNEQAANLKEQSKASAITGVHGGKNTHLKKRPYKKKPKDQYIKRENRNAVHKIKLAKTLNRNKDDKSKHSKYADEKAQKRKKLKHKYIDRPLSSQQKQDIFLRYNPEFQRFPRFLQDENRYRNVMEKRAMENPRYFHNTYDRFPISNDYFIKPKRGDFVKREEEETTTQGKKQTETEEAVSESSVSNLAEEAATIPESESNPDQGSTMGNRQKFEQPNGNAADTATLPPAAKDILETAESDLFENTTLPGLLAVDNNNPQIQNKTNNMITPLIFTTNADDLTEGTECSAEPGARQEKFTPCPDENLNHSSVTMTSILPIISEDVTLLRTNISKEDYIDLNEIIGGSLPKDIVSQSLSNAKGSIRKGLNVKRYNTNIQLSGYNNSLETKMILDEMSNLMMKLKYHTSCQQLTPDLKSYLKIITRNEMDSVLDKVKDMEDVDLDEHQSSYLFHSGETESLPSKATVMKQLLAKFNALPDNCKERAEPVKEYIESHLAMIDNASGHNVSSQAPAPKEHTKTKKEINELNSGNEDNLENQVIVEGLSNSNANANEVIEDIKKDKRETNEVSYDQDISTSTSQQYGRLAEAVRKMRNRRENEKRISQIYGKAKRSPKNDQELAGNHGFESPLLINY